MKFVSRKQWGAQYAQGSGSIPGPVRGTTCHWEGPKMGNFPHRDCARKVRSIERFHAVFRGWSGIAYNALVCPHGYVFEGRGVGVRSAANGTSNIGGNDQWYAVCYLSGQGDGFTDEGKRGFLDAFAWLRSQGGAGRAVNGHRDHHATECPGGVIYAWAHSKKNIPKHDTTQEDDLTPEQAKTLNEISRDVNVIRREQRSFKTHERGRYLRLLQKVRQATALASAGATPADVRGLLNDLDAEIALYVNEATEAEAQAAGKED